MADGPLRLVPREALRGVWPHVRPGVEAIRTRCREPWLAEDVYAEIRAGVADLWLGAAGAFVVTKLERADYSGERSLVIWLGWERPGADSIVAAAVDQLRDVARQAGIRTVAWESPRRGWERRAPALGMRPERTRWVTEAER